MTLTLDALELGPDQLAARLADDEVLMVSTDLLKVADEDKREVAGLAVPYGELLERPSFFGPSKWKFAEGAANVRDGAQLFYGHDHLSDGMPIGRIVSSEQTPAGLRIVARLSKTAKADEVYELLKDGVLDRFSIGFRRKTSRIEDEDSNDPVLVFEDVEVWETSVVPDPAYRSAVIDSVLSRRTPAPEPVKEPAPMPDVIDPDTLASREDLDTLSASVDTLSRQIATLGDNVTLAAGDQPDVPVVGESYGEFIQMLSAGDESAMAFLEYVGGVVGDLGDWVKDTWVGDIIREVENQRTVTTFFEQAPLPATGMRVEYGKLLADETQVAEQVNEGDELPYGKIKFTTDTAPLKTYGGWGEMSRQEIERSAMTVVERFFRYLVRRYGKVTENATRAKLSAAAGAHRVYNSDLSTSDGWIDFLVDSAVYLDDKGLALSDVAVFVGKTAFKDLAKLRDGDNADAPRLLTRDSGSVNVTGLSGDVYNLPIKLVGNLSPGAIRVAHPAAIRTFEAAGAPWRLQDEDITKLTKAFSIYGYQAVAEQEPDAIVVPMAGAAPAGN